MWLRLRRSSFGGRHHPDAFALLPARPHAADLRHHDRITLRFFPDPRQPFEPARPGERSRIDVVQVDLPLLLGAKASVNADVLFAELEFCYAGVEIYVLHVAVLSASLEVSPPLGYRL